MKVFKVLDFFSSVGKEFQVETTRLLKKFFLMSVLFLEGIKFMAYAVLLVGLTTFSPTNVNLKRNMFHEKFPECTQN